MPETADEILKTAAAAKLLGFSEDTLIKAADEGKVPCWKTPGGHRRFRRSVLLAFLEGSYEHAPAEAAS